MASEQPRSAKQRNDEKFSARRAAFSAMLMLLLMLLILLLIAAATDRTDILKFAGMVLVPSGALALQPRLSGVVLAAEENRTKAGPGVPAVAIVIKVDPRFQAYYDACGGVQMLGLPISAAGESGGRVVQWFERARLEIATNRVGGVQRARIGAEYLAGITLPQQTPFVNRPSARFFPQTGHGITTPFLAFWEQAGRVAALGYTLSEQIQEIMPNGEILTVQYFERGRFEVHPQLVGTPYIIQVGLLGRAVFLSEAKPNLIPPVRPTALVP